MAQLSSIPCKTCGAQFAPRNGLNLYCSQSCKPAKRGRGPSRTGSAKSYRWVLTPGHPLADDHGRAAVHRCTLFERIGPGEHPCHWCGAVVRWMRGVGRGMLVADHVDGDTTNNDSSNIVQSCQRCNAMRNGHPNSRKTHCPQGHEYDSANTYITPSTGDRLCRECIRTRNRERMRRLRRESVARLR